MENFKFVCPCLMGVEGLVAEELKRIDAQNVKAQNARVMFEGGYDIMARANLWSRYSERVQILVGEFEAKSFNDLFEGVKALPWERFISKNDAFPVKGRSLNSKLTSIPDCQSIIKKAIVERLKQVYKISWFEENANKYQIQFLIMKDHVSMMIDTSGEGLHKRGYRKNANEAPIKETLAASMAKLARINDRSFVIDPFCGSGTILIESALLAHNIAPGLRRTFVSESWEQVPKKVWLNERELAISQIKKGTDFHAVGYDIDDEAVILATENVKKVGLENKIHIEKRDIRKFTETAEKATVICNPPYGERLLDKKKARELYGVIGDLIQQKNEFGFYVISPDEEFEKCVRKKADKKRKLYNGMIKCDLYMFFKKH